VPRGDQDLAGEASTPPGGCHPGGGSSERSAARWSLRRSRGLPRTSRSTSRTPRPLCRLARASEASRGDPGEHLLEHQPAERVAIGEVLVSAKRDLGLTSGAAHARTLDCDTPPTERDLAVLVAVADRDAIGVVLDLRADHILDLRLHQFGQHADPRRRRSARAAPPSPLRRAAPAPPELDEGSGSSTASSAVTTFTAGTVLVAVPPVSDGLHTPSRFQPKRTRWEDHHLRSSTSYGTTSSPAGPVPGARGCTAGCRAG
jgi:hypothetical protein